jgi:hypothetical protein
MTGRYIDDDHGDLELMRQQEDDIILRRTASFARRMRTASFARGCALLGALARHPACTVAPRRDSLGAAWVPGTLVLLALAPGGDILASNAVGDLQRFAPEDLDQAVAWAMET